MNKFQIDKSVPVPLARHGRGPVYPFKEMGIGDSFIVPPERSERLRNAAHAHGARAGKKFAVRKQPDGVRCWRIE